jgi:hypothetical protein
MGREELAQALARKHCLRGLGYPKRKRASTRKVCL